MARHTVVLFQHFALFRQKMTASAVQTAMAAPRVSGAVALALERVPDLTNVQAKMLLCESARDLGLPRNRQGHGMLQTDRFLSLL